MSVVVALQKVHDAWPLADVDTRPGAHARHDARADAPGDGEKVSSGHCKHSSMDVAPTTALHVPLGHSEHVRLPAVGLKDPAPHGSQALRAALGTVPLGQTVQVAEPACATVPRGQGVHSRAPAPEAVPYVQLLQLLWPCRGAAVPGLHCKQAVLPDSDVKLPGAHASHMSPDAARNDPGKHARHWVKNG